MLETMDPEKLQILQLKSFSVLFSELMIVPNFIAVYMTRQESVPKISGLLKISAMCRPLKNP